MGEELSVTVLGCDGSYPGPGGACSGYLVEHSGTRVWLDAGSGTLANLQRHADIEQIDAVVVTHRHPDHWTDLEHLAVAFKWVARRAGPPVYSDGSIHPLMRVGAAAEVFDWRTVGDGSRIVVGGMGVSFSRTDHPVTTLAVRIDAGGRSLAYSADTGPGWEISALGGGIDLALCEATFLSGAEGSTLHLSARQAGLGARAAGVGRLVITHAWPRVDKAAARAEASEAFGSEVRSAQVGERYIV